MRKFRIYIDETGNPDLNSSDNPNHRFLSLTGVIIDLEYVKNVLAPDLDKIKTEFFDPHPDEPIVLHRKEIINRKYPFENLRDPEVENKFNECILQKLKEWDYKVITVLIDKKEHKEKYKVWKYDPYHYCLAVLLERYLFFLEEINLVGDDVMGDVMIESRGGKEDKRLEKSYSRLYLNGTEFIEGKRFHNVLTSKQLKVKPKIANIAGLQLADLIAHPSRRQMLLHLGLMKKEKEIFSDKIIDIIQSKYYKKGNKLYGYGLKKLP